METIEECLDHILQTLIESGDSIYLMCIDKVQRNNRGETLYKVSDEYTKMYEPLNLNNSQFMELLGILKENKYIEYQILYVKQDNYMVVTYPEEYYPIWFKNKETSEVIDKGKDFEGFKMLLAVNAIHIGQCQFVSITLKGKYFRRQAGGYYQKVQREIQEKERNNKNEDRIIFLNKILSLATVILAVGTIGMLIFEALRYFQ